MSGLSDVQMQIKKQHHSHQLLMAVADRRQAPAHSNCTAPAGVAVAAVAVLLLLSHRSLAAASTVQADWYTP
jgi:uncharacterized membrane protein